ncbi:MAG: hypothetical protein ACK4GT_04045, partial [Pararhodobacter sp.]
AVGLIWVWARKLTVAQDQPPVEIAPGQVLPVHYHVRTTLVESGNWALLFANAVFLGCLIFGVAFLELVSPGPVPPAWGVPSLPAMVFGLAVALMALAASVCGRMARAWPGRVGILPLAGTALNLAALLAVLVFALWLMPDPTRHARDAVRAALVSYGALHLIISGLFAAFVTDQARRGELAATRSGSLRNWSLWQDFTALVVVVAVGLVWLQEAGA